MVKSPAPPKPTLTPHERAVITAASTGDIADFSDLDSPPIIQAEMLRRLIAGLAQKRRKHADPVAPRGVRIHNAVIEGALDLSGWTGRADEPSRFLPTIELQNCILDEPLSLEESHIDSLSLLGCSLVRLSAGSARIEGSVYLNGSRVTGAGSKENDSHFALDFAGAKIGGNVTLRVFQGRPFESHSQITFLGAQITGAFNASGARLLNPGGIALNFTRADIRNSAFMTSDQGIRFTAKGELRFWITQIGGQFAINGALLENKSGLALGLDGATIRGNVFMLPSDNGTPVTIYGDLRLVGTRIESNLVSRDIVMDGVFDARNAYISVLFDDARSSWPAKPGHIRLSGLAYDRLHGNAEERRDNSLAQRLDWIKRQYLNPEHPTAAEFDPQPYNQYAKVLRARGQSTDADRVLITMREWRLRSHIDPWPMRIFQKFLGLTSGYGYAGTRAVVALILWIIIGTGMYGAHAFAGHFGPAEDVLQGEHSTVQQTPVSIPGIAQTRVRGCPGLIAPLYAMDTLLPVVEFGQRRAVLLIRRGRWAHLCGERWISCTR
ncbi:MAG: hypothetical protein Q9M45_03955 [Robiginitomaculum sp.]|nr:hypothetical protein [Robiginitomaculum sp.]